MNPAASNWNVPNLLSLSRIPLAVILFISLTLELWRISLLVFLLAALTDALDGWWARKFQQSSPLGRMLDPLTDKILLGGTFIFFITIPEAAISAWMTTVIISRELLVTGIRGMIEATGRSFGADWFGKLKTILQFLVVLVFLLLQAWRDIVPINAHIMHQGYLLLVYSMLLATAGSGLQYLVKAWPILMNRSEPMS